MAQLDMRSAQTIRSDDPRADGMFSYISSEQRVPPDNPLRTIRRLTDEA
jgi:hypothetical protein